MVEQEKPFICLKNGWSMKITPRNAAGRWALFVWALAMIIPTALFIWLMARTPSEPKVVAYVTGYVLLVTGWVIAMLRWTYLRSEVIDIDELLELKRERDRQMGRR